MAHIVFAAPGVDRFHLHDRLQRELVRRQHRVTVLGLDAATAAFYTQQGLPTVGAEWTGAGQDGDDPGAPLAEFAAIDQRRGGRSSARRQRRLQRTAAWLRRWFDAHRVDLVLLHQQRDADHALLHFLAREHGCRVLWTGEGLLPHTLQLDERGLDGDASASRRRVMDYRVVRAEPPLLAAALTHTLGGSAPFALTPRAVALPPLQQRLAALRASWREGGLDSVVAAWRTFRGAARPAAAPAPDTPLPFALPAAPFVSVLLQPGNDDRRRLDADDAPQDAALVAAAARAARALDPELRLVIVAAHPQRARSPQVRHIDGTECVRVSASAAATAAATGLATITVNHPAASVALLAGTPVLHLGAALYGLPGVTTRSHLEALPTDLARAISHDHPTLRQRFLTWLFGHGHVWCSATRPDHNGLCGLVQAIEARLGRPAGEPPLRYRSGPAWPLAADRA
ncbi:MAG: hypothetical protein IT455_08265 [Planctomycetes bacterium]|nr:hypothetical protein [Planctomycetota bacterium]